MNTLVFIVYLIGIIPAIISAMASLVSFTNIVAISAIVVGSLAYFIPSDAFINEYANKPEEIADFKEKKSKTAKFSLKVGFWAFIVSTVFSFIQASVPPQKTAWMMAGTYAAGQIIANPKLQETTGNVVNLINSKVKAETLELNASINDLQKKVDSQEKAEKTADDNKEVNAALKSAQDAAKSVADDSIKSAKTAAKNAASDAIKNAVDTAK